MRRLALLAVPAALAAVVLLARRPSVPPDRAAAPPVPARTVPARPPEADRPAAAAATPVAARPEKRRLDGLLDGLLEAIRAGDRERMTALARELLDGAVPPPLPDAGNGALAYLKAFEKMTALTDAERAALQALRQGTPTPDQVAALEAMVAANAEAIALLKEAAGWTRCRYPVEYRDGFDATLPHIIKILRAGDLLEADAFLARRAGQDDAASASALGRLADSLEDEPLIISQAIRDQLLERAREGDPATVRPVWERVVRMEMAAASLWAAGQAGVQELSDPKSVAMAEHYFETMRQMAGLVTQPWYVSNDGLVAIERGIASGDWRAEGTRLFAPSLSRAMERVARVEAALGAAVDPFSGRPMIARGDLLYSVGPNGVDDGGDPRLDILVRRR